MSATPSATEVISRGRRPGRALRCSPAPPTTRAPIQASAVTAGDQRVELRQANHQRGVEAQPRPRRERQEADRRGHVPGQARGEGEAATTARGPRSRRASRRSGGSAGRTTPPADLAEERARLGADHRVPASAVRTTKVVTAIKGPAPRTARSGRSHEPARRTASARRPQDQEQHRDRRPDLAEPSPSGRPTTAAAATYTPMTSSGSAASPSASAGRQPGQRPLALGSGRQPTRRAHRPSRARSQIRADVASNTTAPDHRSADAAATLGSPRAATKRRGQRADREGASRSTRRNRSHWPASRSADREPPERPRAAPERRGVRDARDSNTAAAARPDRPPTSPPGGRRRRAASTPAPPRGPPRTTASPA